MGMEPFDYLTYKRNKAQNQKPVSTGKRKKLVVGIICTTLFAALFFALLSAIASKSATIDIEYGRFGQPQEQKQTPAAETKEDDFAKEEETEPQERFTIDKRLFLIRQEEKGPSESKVINPLKEQAEVISKKEFEIIKNNSNEVIQNSEKNMSQKQILKTTPQEQTETETRSDIIVPDFNKAVIKPKLPVEQQTKLQTSVVKPTQQATSTNNGFKQLGALDVKSTPAKVLIGKYSTIEEARKVQSQLPSMPDGAVPFVKKINNYYSIQVGAYQNFDVAKSVAGKLKLRGFSVWILQ